MVARLGGDEFVVVQTEVKTLAEVGQFAQRLADALTATIQYNEQEIVATVSIGVALAPTDGTESGAAPEKRRPRALQAQGRRPQLHPLLPPEMDAALQARIALEKTMRDAVANERFDLHYQPIFEMSANASSASRPWSACPRADGTLIPPMAFHSGRRGNAADRQDRRVGAARGLPDRRDLAGKSDRRGEPVAGAIRSRQRQRRRRRGSQGPAWRRTGSSSKSPKACCWATAKPSWRSCRSSKRWVWPS